jgi:hypothetical protein
MNRRGGGFHRPMGERSARAPTTARPWPEHDRQTALHPVGFLAGRRCSGGIGFRVRLPARCLAPPIIFIGWWFATWCAGSPTRR